MKHWFNSYEGMPNDNNFTVYLLLLNVLLKKCWIYNMKYNYLWSFSTQRKRGYSSSKTHDGHSLYLTTEVQKLELAMVLKVVQLEK